MIYGLSGSGKTWYCRAAMDAVGAQRTLWLHTERPIYSFEPHMWTAGEPWGVKYMPDATVDDLLKVLQPVRNAARAKKWLYDLVVLDGITEADFVNMAAIEENSDSRDKRQNWGEQSDDLLRLFWAMRAGEREPAAQHLGAHVIITAGVREIPHPTEPLRKDGSMNMLFRPGIRGQWGTHGDRYFNQVLYSEKVGTMRRIWLKSTGAVHVKNDWEHLKGCPQSITVRDYDTGHNAFSEVLKACELVTKEEVKSK